MATIKTSGLASGYYNDYSVFEQYDSASDLNDFLDSYALGVASGAASLLSNELGYLVPALKPILQNAKVSIDGKSVFDSESGLTLTGTNLGALQKGGKGSAIIKSFSGMDNGTAVQLDGVITVNSKGVASGVINSASYYTPDSHTQVNFAGSAMIKAGSLSSVAFTSAVVTTYDGDPLKENIDHQVAVTGNFTLGTEGGPNGTVTGISYVSEGENQLNVSGIKGLLLSDVLDHGFDKASILSGNDTITVSYTDKNTYYAPEIVHVTSLSDYQPGTSIEGYAGDDTLIGGDRSDTLIGDSGSDVLRGNAGNDWLDGGTGADRMFGGAGNDTYILDNAKDSVIESSTVDGGNDTILLEISKDFNIYKMANSVENAFVDIYNDRGLSLDSVVSATIVGNNLDNLIVGGLGSDALYGDSGNDVLVGDSFYNGAPFGGDDTLNGGAGNDVLYGGLGHNTLTGGAGADLFVHSSDLSFFGEDTPTDHITDFKVGTDKLVIEMSWVSSADTDSLATTGTLASGNALFDSNGLTLKGLDRADFHKVASFNADATFTESGVYFDSSDKEVWYVEHHSNYDTCGASAYSNVTLIATLEGNVNNLSASDIAVAFFNDNVSASVA